MSDLRDDLRQYFDHLADEALAATAIEPTRAPARSHWARWVAVAAALVVGVVAGVVLVRSGSDSDQTLRTGPSTAVPLTQAEREAMQAGWERIPGAFPDTATVLDVTEGPSGFVAVGYLQDLDPTTNGPLLAALWTSADGRKWVLDPAAISGTRVDGIAYWRGAYWAAVDSSVLRSEDLREWRPAGSLESAGPLDPEGFLFGEEAAGLVAYGYGRGIAFSSDGMRWESTNVSTPALGITYAGSKWYALVAGTSRLSDRHLFVYSSEDGRTWRSEVELGVTEDPGGAAITTWNGEVWATAYVGGAQHRNTLWRSNGDGEWTAVDADNPRDTSFDTLTVVGKYLVGTGFDTGSRPGGWATLDGSNWVPMELDQPPGGRLNVAAGSNSILVALSTSELKDAYRWTAPVVGTTPPTSVARPAQSSIARPGDIAVDRNGVLYVANLDPPGIFRINADGTVVSIAGNGVAGESGDIGLATDASLVSPHALTFDDAGELYFIDGNRVRHIDADGYITTVAGRAEGGFNGDGGPATAARLRGPTHLAFSPDGALYISDQGNERVRRVGRDGTITTFAGTGLPSIGAESGPATQVDIDPGALAFGPGGNLYVYSRVGSRMHVITPDGMLSRVPHGGRVTDFAAGPDGVIYVANDGFFQVDRILPDGTVDPWVGFNQLGTARISALQPRPFRPGSITVAPNGDVYVIDPGTGGGAQRATIVRITTDGIVQEVAL